jgi:hypothetical protein
MPLATIRTQIEAILKAADPGSKVYAYRRWITQPDALIAELQPVSGGPVRVWMFWVESIAEALDTYTQTNQDYVIGFRFYRSLVDADQSEILVADLLQTVRAAFRANETLNGSAFTIIPTAGSMKGAVGLQLDGLEMVTLGGVLCHEARLRLGVEELLTV